MSGQDAVGDFNPNPGTTPSSTDAGALGQATSEPGQGWADIPGVARIQADDDSMTVDFTNGRTATVQRCPISRMLGRDLFNLLTPPVAGAAKPVFAVLVRSRTAEQIVADLTQMARQGR